MKGNQHDFSKFGFARTFILPALLVFLVPVLALLFFLHAQGRFDKQAREVFLEQVRTDPQLSDEDRAAWTALFNEVPVSKLVTDENFAPMLKDEARFHYATFRWMIRLSAWSIVAGIAVFLVMGVCVLFSLYSHLAQYLSLSVGWHVLRIYGALATLAQGVLLVALSYWVTALWFNVYSPKLIFVIGALAVVAVGYVIYAIFRRPNMDHVVAGKVIEPSADMRLWHELRDLCTRVGTEPPDQVIAGIDDRFFVTELPVIVDGKTYHGRTLYVSLSLLKQLEGSEADAVLAHEMAHFHGQDTLYSKKIAPLLMRYDTYLQTLYEGGITLPIFYFMLCFRALYQLSLGRLSRQREFRADQVAAQTTSPRDFAGALLRIVAYSHYRGSIEQDLFRQEQALESANISERIEQGFPAYAVSFTSDPAIGDLQTSHPFDSHPPLHERLEAVGVSLGSAHADALLAAPGNGRWFHNIQNAENLEREQWTAFEDQFRRFHEETLPYRFLPETDAERTLVVKFFPEITYEGKDGALTLDHEKIAFASWPEPLFYREVTQMALDDDNTLHVHYEHDGKKKHSIKVKKFPKEQQQEVLGAINRYYTRYLAAVQYQEQKKLELTSEGK